MLFLTDLVASAMPSLFHHQIHRGPVTIKHLIELIQVLAELSSIDPEATRGGEAVKVGVQRGSSRRRKGKHYGRRGGGVGESGARVGCSGTNAPDQVPILLTRRSLSHSFSPLHPLSLLHYVGLLPY